MSVFISHRKIDSYIATIICISLIHKRVKVYIDELDEKIKETNDITTLIMERVDKCSHMLVVVSENTQGSWWVPFEIGVASRACRRITTYRSGRVINLPDFLSKWPILKNNNDLQDFIKLYKQDMAVPILEGETFTKAAYSISEAEAFHSQLKTLIGQK